MKAISILKHLMTFCGVELHNDCAEAIAELEALQQPKSCDDCKNRVFYTYDSFKQVTIDKCSIREQLHFNGSCDGLCCDKYESKEQQ